MLSKRKSRSGRALVLAATAAVGSLLVTNEATAQTTYTNGASSGLWSDAANWDAGEPTAGVNAILPVTFNAITLGTGEQANALLINGGYTLGGGDLTLTTGAITVAPTFTATLNSTLAGTAGLTVNPLADTGTGVLVLGGTNTFTGPIAINAGTLRFGAITAINDASATNNITLGTATSVATLDFTGASATLTRAITFGSLAGSATGNVINVATAGQTLTLNGRLTGGATGTNNTLTITGPGVLAIGNNATALGTENSFTGNIVVDGGGVSIVGLNGVNNTGGTTNASEGTQFGAGDKTITLTNGGRFINNTTTYNPIANAGHIKTIVIGPGGGTIEANAQVSLDDAGQFAGVGGGALTKTGTNRLMIRMNATSYDSPNTYLNAGILDLRDVNALGDNLPSLSTKSVINMAAGTTLDLRLNASGAYNYPVVMAGDGTINVDRVDSGSNYTHTLGTITLPAGTLNLTGGNGVSLTTGAATLSGNLTIAAPNTNLTVATLDAGAGAPARTITKTGEGFFAVTGGGSNFSGTTTVNATGGIGIGANNTFGSAANITVTGTNGEYYQIGAALPGYTYTVPSDGILGGDSAFLGSVNTSGAGANLNVFPTTIAQATTGANAALASRVGFANDASRLFAISANVSDTVTVGTGTPWYGVGNDRISRAMPTPVITANSDFQIRSSGATFVFGNAGNPTITLGAGVTSVNANIVGGTVQFSDTTPIYPNTVTFVVNNGATLQNTAANAFGANTAPGGAGNNASVNVLAGGVWNPNGSAAINANVTIQVGGILNLDDGANLSGTGVITQFPGSITRITNTGGTVLNGSLSAGTVPGSIVRVSTNTIAGLGLGGVTGTNPASNYVVNVAASTVNNVNGLSLLPAAAVTLNSTGTVIVPGTLDPIPTAVFTNDGANRIVTSNSSTANSVITIGAGGGTIAASSGFTFTLRGNPSSGATAGVSVAAGTNTLNIGVPTGSGLIDGQAKAGTVDIAGPAGTSIVAGSVNIYSGTLQNLSGGMSYTIGGGTGVTRVFNGASFISTTGTLSGTTLQVDAGGFGRFRAGGTDNAVASQAIGGLQGTGTVTIGNSSGTNRDVILTVGSNNASTLFSGNITDQDSGRQGGIIKTGTGTLSLAGSNTYTLATSVNLGTLALTGGSLGGTAVTVGSGATPTATAGNATFNVAGNRTIGTATAGSLTISGGSTGATPIGQGTLSLIDGTANVLTLTDRTTNATTFTFGGNTAGTNGILNLEVGTSADRIELGAGDTILIGNGGSHVVNLTGIGGLSGTTPLVLINAPGGLAAGSAPFSQFTLGSVTGNFAGYTVALDTTSATQLLLTVTPVAGAGTAYWVGDVDGNWNTNTAGNTNFATDATGATDVGSLPVASTNVFFAATGAANLSTTLGADTAINSLNFTGTGTPAASNVTIAGNTLTINATGANGNTAGNGISVAAGSGAHTISSNVVVGTSQSWTNNGSNPLSVSGNIDLAANTLTVAGTGSTNLSGVVSGTGGIVKSGTGTATISSTGHTYTGPTAINQGTLAVTASQSFNNTLTFGSTTAITTVGTLNVSSADVSFTGLTAQNNSTSANNITIGAGRTLTINGNVLVGSPTNNADTILNVSGATGTLSVNSPEGFVRIGNGPTGTNATSLSRLDLSGLGTFNADLGINGTFVVNFSGDNSASNPTTVNLAANANTIRAGTLTIGGSSAGNDAANGPNQLRLGSGTNVLNVNAIVLGSGVRDSGELEFLNSNGSVVVRANNGTGRAALTMGSGGATTGYALDNAFNVAGHNADLLLGAVSLGTQASRGGNAVNTLSFDQGAFDATSLTLSSGKTAGAGTSTSTVNFGGGTVTIANGILQMGNHTATTGTVGGTIANLNVSGGTVAIGATGGVAIRTATATTAGYTSTATINLTGGTTTLAGDIIRGGGSVNSTTTLTLNGGTLNMSGNDIGDATNPISTLNFQAGVLANVASINGTGGLTKTTGGTLTITGTTAYSGPTAVSAGTLLVNGPLTGSGAVTASTGSTLGGIGSIAGPITISPGATLQAGDGLTASDDLAASGGLAMGDGSVIRLTLGSAGAHSTLTRTGGVFTFDSDQAFAFADAGATVGFYDNVITGLAADPNTSAWTIVTPSFVGTFTFDGSGGPGNVDLTLTAVPEPATAALLALGGIGLLARRRRRA